MENLCFVDHDGEFRLTLHNLELDTFEIAVHDEGVALLYGAEVVLELVLQLHLEEIAGDALNTVREGQHVDLRAVGQVVDLGDRDHVAKLHADVFAQDLVQLEFLVLTLAVVVNEEHSGAFVSAFAAQQDHV